MPDGNGWTKYEREVMGRLDYLRDDMRAVIKSVTDHTEYCNARFAEHAKEIGRSKLFGVVSGGGIVLVFVLTLLILQTIQ